jgi:hypothetical protein
MLYYLPSLNFCCKFFGFKHFRYNVSDTICTYFVCSPGEQFGEISMSFLLKKSFSLFLISPICYSSYKYFRFIFIWDFAHVFNVLLHSSPCSVYINKCAVYAFLSHFHFTLSIHTMLSDA